MNERELLHALSLPFHPSHITWKPGALNKDRTSALALAYADLRAYMVRLDEVCGMSWSVNYTPWNERIICNLTINGVTRSSTGEPDSQSEKSEIGGTAAEAQAFKRACAMFGMGRYLYNLPSVWAEYDNDRKQFTAQGKGKLDGIIAEHYRRNTAETKSNSSNKVTAGSQTESVSTTNTINGIGVQTSEGEKSPDLINPSQLAELEELAQEVYAKNREPELKRLTDYVTHGRTNDHTQLQQAEAVKLIDGLINKLAKRSPIRS